MQNRILVCRMDWYGDLDDGCIRLARRRWKPRIIDWNARVSS